MALSPLIKDYMQSGLLAARPTTPNVAAGVAPLYYATDTLSTYLWDGTAWVTITGAAAGVQAFGEYAYRPPVATDFPTTITVGTSAVTTLDVAGKGLRVQNTRNGNGGIGLMQTPPALPFTITIRFTAASGMVAPLACDVRAGLVLRNSTSGRCLVQYRFNDTIFLQEWSTVDGFAGNISSVAIPRDEIWSGAFYFALNVAVGGAVTPYVSFDGATWVPYGGTNIATYLNAAGGSLDQIGFWSNPNSGAGGRIDSLISYWRVDAINPPDPAFA